MLRRVIIFAILMLFLLSACSGSNYIYEKSWLKGTGYKSVEKVVSTQIGFNGSKLVEKESGSGNIILDRSELEAERQIGSGCGGSYNVMLSVWQNPENKEPTMPEIVDQGVGDFGPWGPWIYWDDFAPFHLKYRYRQWPTGFGPMDYINYTKQAEYEYMPVSYQTGTYDQKWTDKLCVQNYRIGAAMTEMYTHAEHLQKTTEVKTRSYRTENQSFSITAEENETKRHFSIQYPPTPCCTGVLEANLNSNVIGTAHIGWISRDLEPSSALKGRHAEYGRSVEDLTGVFSIEKFIQLWGNSTCGAVSVDWLPCV